MRGEYLGAKRPLRRTVRSLKRVMHAAKTKGHKIVRDNGIEGLATRWSIYPNENTDQAWEERYEISMDHIKPTLEQMYQEQLDWRGPGKNLITNPSFELETRTTSFAGEIVWQSTKAIRDDEVHFTR
jgi:hypothetical protein